MDKNSTLYIHKRGYIIPQLLQKVATTTMPAHVSNM
uniref:Uncharacterized protein n=1 Tax=Setaria italica TaxID=4555 RepID=K3YNW3_SETIT